MVYKLLNGLFLYQLEPSFFITRQDLVTWLFMQTGLHQWLLNNTAGCIIFDILFYSMPLAYLRSFNYFKRSNRAIAVIMLIVNWCYVQCYTLYPSNSIEGHVAWLFFPVIFIANNPKTFSLLFQGLRYFFIFFIVSAGVWKLAQGGAFNPSQMSGVLLFQHNQLLTSSPGYWQSELILYLIQNPQISYWLYLSATLLELFFFIGFFTKKYDRLLVLLFVLFLVMDFLIMRIPYFEITPLLLTLLMKWDESKTTS
ncbi:MAG: hypothetical protein ABI921_05275 [Panacibacter sp.]